MVLLNLTRKKRLIRELREYATMTAKGVGLMGRIEAPGYGVLFPFKRAQKVTIHMLFVFFPLDILWLDDKKRVIDLRSLKPFRAHTCPEPASFVLELPAGTIERTGTAVGDQLKF